MYRNYKGKERKLLFETETEIFAKFSKKDSFKPTLVLNQFKLSTVIRRIFKDLGLITEQKLTEYGKNLVNKYHV